MNDIKTNTQQESSTDRRVSRRHVLTTALTGTAIGLSGCLGGLLGTASVITNTTFRPFKLTVTLREQASTDSVTLLTPQGTVVSEQRLSAGQTTASLWLLETKGSQRHPLAPGTYQLAVGNDGGTVAKQDIQLTASWELTAVRIQHREHQGSNLVGTLKNTGALPIKVTYFSVTDGVPNPDAKPGEEIGKPVRMNLERYRLQRFVGGGRHATFRTYSEPFVFESTEERHGSSQWRQITTQCRGQTRTASLVLVTVPTGKRIYSVPTTYAGQSIPGLTSRHCSNVTAGTISNSTSHS